MINLTKYKKYVLIKKEGEKQWKIVSLKISGGGDSPR